MQKKRFGSASASLFSLFTKPLQSRRGQVTLFIIVGIILLLALVLVFALRKEVVTFNPEEIAPAQRGTVAEFLTTCVDRLGGEALDRAGVQSGYVQVPEQILNDGGLALASSPFSVIPYWAVGEQRYIPSLHQVKEGVDLYIEQNLRDCLFSDAAFSERYVITEKSDLVADTQFLDGKTIFRVYWTIEIRDRAGEVLSEVREHTAETDVKFKRLHETAVRVVEQELADLKLEDITQDLLALEHPDVPLAGYEFSCSKKRWSVASARSTFLDLLRINIGRLQVSGAEVLTFPKELSYSQNHYVWDIGELAPSVAVEFSYDESFPTSFSVGPRSGTHLESGSLGGSRELRFLCLQSWKFTYDLMYPVVVDVVDETTGFRFKTALTVHLQRNLPDRSSVGISEPTFLSAPSDEEYCSESRFTMLVTTNELVDADGGVFYSQPLEDVNLTFNCLYYSCDIGQTEYGFGGIGDAAALRTQFPSCSAGVLRGEKPGYKDGTVFLTPQANGVVDLSLTPLKQFGASSFSFVAHELNDGAIGVGRELDIGEGFIRINLERVGYDANVSEAHESSLLYSSNVNQEGDPSSLDLLAGGDYTYDLRLEYFDENFQLRGGYSGNWTARWSEISTAEGLTFHLVDAPLRSEDEQYNFYLTLPETSQLVEVPQVR